MDFPTMYDEYPTRTSNCTDATESPFVLPYGSMRPYPLSTRDNQRGIQQYKRKRELERLLRRSVRNLTPKEIERQAESWIRSLRMTSEGKPRIRVKAKGVRW